MQYILLIYCYYVFNKNYLQMENKKKAKQKLRFDIDDEKGENFFTSLQYRFFAVYLHQ